MSDMHSAVRPEDPEAPAEVSGETPEPGPDRPTRLRVFKRLRAEKTETLEHRMGTLPSVDVYRLDHFPVVASADGTTHDAWVNFYLHHTSDRSVTRPGAGRLTLTDRGTRFPLARLLDEYGVPYDDRSSLGDLVTEFWKALFADPSDPFDETGYASSPWLDRCCGDRRTVREVKRSGGWDDLWLHFRPRKTINHPRPSGTATDETGATGAPPALEVTHVDYDTLALRLLPPYDGLYAGDPSTGEPGVPETADIDREEVPVMLLLHG